MKVQISALALLTLLAACSDKSETPKTSPEDLTPRVIIDPNTPQNDSDPTVPVKPNPSTKIKLGLNDVSVLFPYFEIPSLFTLMPEFRNLYPESYLRVIDDRLKADNPSADINTTLPRIGDDPSFFVYRLVSLRFDTCANIRELAGDACRHELRLVWQRVVDAGSGVFFFEDNMIHTIHELTTQETQAAIAILRTAKSKAKTDTLPMPLGPNPTIIEEGLGSEYFKSVMSLVRDYVKPANLSAIAYFANTNRTTGNWPMLKFSKAGDSFSPFIIPNTNGAEIQRMAGRLAFTAPNPLPNEADSVFRDANTQALVNNAFRIENPSLHSAHDTDCASCHRADLERSLSLKGNPGLRSESPDAYRNTNWDLSSKFGVGPALSLQMFSYFDTSVKIAPRVINTTAVICDLINADKITAP